VPRENAWSIALPKIHVCLVRITDAMATANATVRHTVTPKILTALKRKTTGCPVLVIQFVNRIGVPIMMSRGAMNVRVPRKSGKHAAGTKV
jgi:hypothetical protein